MRRILIVCTTDSMIWNFLIPHIKELEKKNIVVECACSRTGFYFDELEQIYNIKLHEINFARKPFKIQNIGAFKKLSKLIKFKQYDVIYGHEPVGGAMARLAGKANRKKVIYASHGFHFFKHAPIKHWILYYSFEFVLSFFTDAIITICSEDYENAKKLHAKRIYKIPGIGVDFSKYDVSNRELMRKSVRKELGLTDNDIVLVSVGELSERKNHSVILKAMSCINNEHIHLILVGEGQLENYLEEKARDLSLSDRVHFLGFRRDVPSILCAADIFVFPSLWEGLGLAGIEAMYSGLPIIGSNRQGIKDYIINNKTGFLFEPTNVEQLCDSINRMLNDEKNTKEMALEGKKLIEMFSIDNSIKALNEIYEAEGLFERKDKNS